MGCDGPFVDACPFVGEARIGQIGGRWRFAETLMDHIDVTFASLFWQSQNKLVKLLFCVTPAAFSHYFAIVILAMLFFLMFVMSYAASASRGAGIVGSEIFSQVVYVECVIHAFCRRRFESATISSR